MPEISDDELEAMLERKPTVREAKVDDHALMVETWLGYIPRKECARQKWMTMH